MCTLQYRYHISHIYHTCEFTGTCVLRKPSGSRAVVLGTGQPRGGGQRAGHSLCTSASRGLRDFTRYAVRYEYMY